MARILIISFSDLKEDPRVFRQISHLSKKNDVAEMGLGPSQITVTDFIPLKIPRKKNVPEKIIKVIRLLLHRYTGIYWNEFIDFGQIREKLSGRQFDIIIANELDSLPLAVRIKKDAKIVFDAHEYSPKQNEDVLSFRIFMMGYINYLCQTYIPEADSMITVSDGIAEEYYSVYGVKPTVITNAPDFYNLYPMKTDDKKIKLIYHGEVSPSRQTELMIKMMDNVDERFCLDLMIKSSDTKYLDKLQELVKKRKNTRIISPVEMNQIIPFSNQYDIGLYILKPNNYNQKFALPNKFFEYIQARLAVAVGPSPEMANIVRKYDLGIVSDDFTPQSMAEKLNRLTKMKIEYYKNRSHSAASQLSSEKNLEKLDSIINELLPEEA